MAPWPDETKIASHAQNKKRQGEHNAHRKFTGLIAYFGIAGLLLMGVVFFGHHVAGLSGNEAFLIFILGFLLVIVEVLLFPGLIIPAALLVGVMIFGGGEATEKSGVGADAVLLIVRILERQQLKDYLALCRELGLSGQMLRRIFVGGQAGHRGAHGGGYYAKSHGFRRRMHRYRVRHVPT